MDVQDKHQRRIRWWHTDWCQNNEVKRKGCSNLKDLIESDKLIIHDLDTISELTTFVAHGQSYQAEEGCHDDLVMTLVLFGWMIEQRYYKEVTDNDLREKIRQSN